MVLRIYTDGACSGNPGPGGWAVVFNKNEECETLCGSEENTTNNRMELLAVIKALEKIKEEKRDNKLKNYSSFEIYSDSAYVVNAIVKGWLYAWKLNGWRTSRGEEIKNKDLWNVLYDLLFEGIKFIKIKGHSGNTFNELVDKLAREQSRKE